MRSFDIDNFPETLQMINDLSDPEEQECAIDAANKLWMASVLMDRPMCLSDEAVLTYAEMYSVGMSYSDLKAILLSLREEIFKSYDMVERFEYTRNNDIDIHNDFQDFLVGIGADEDPAESSIIGLLEFHEMESDSDTDIIDGVVGELQTEYLLTYGRVFTEEQSGYLKDTAIALYEGNPYYIYNKNNFMEDITMTANYKNTEKEMNNHADAMLMLETLLADKEDNVTANEALEEFKNNYFNMLAEDKAYASRKGRRKFAHEVLCELAKVEPKVASLINDDKAEMLIVEKVCNPIIDSVNSKPNGNETVDGIKKAATSYATPKKPLIIRFTTRVFNFIKKIFAAIGKFFKMIAETVGDVYEWILQHNFARTIFDIGTSISMGYNIGVGVKVILAKITEHFGLTLIAGGSPTVPGIIIGIAGLVAIGALCYIYSAVKKYYRERFLVYRGYSYDPATDKWYAYDIKKESYVNA